MRLQLKSYFLTVTKKTAIQVAEARGCYFACGNKKQAFRFQNIRLLQVKA